MKSFSVLIQALYLASSASAFFIWKPCLQDGSCVNKKKVNQARNRLSSRSKPLTFPLTQRSRPCSSSLSRRFATASRIGLERHPEKRSENFYDIMDAITPSYAHTAGINQDGSDLSYFISVGVGSRKTEMYMLVDTGAGTTWIMGSDCTTQACKMHHSFTKSDSTTLSHANTHFSISYGSGSVTGQTVTDSLSIGDVSVNMTFGLANYTSTDFESFPFDGILGLSLNKGSTDSFTQKLSASSAISTKIFSIFLSRASSGSNNGELTLGGINPDRYEGDITYTNLGSATSGDWSIPLAGVSINGEDIGISGRSGYVDTGTSYIFGPPDDVKALHEKIDGAKSSDGSRWTVPCDINKTLAFNFNSKSWSLEKSDWISAKRDDSTCYSYIMGVEVVKGGWLLGDAFIKNVYSVFDMENRAIGFAKAKHASPTSTTGPVGSNGGSSNETSNSGSPTTTAKAQQESATKSAGVLGRSTSRVAAGTCLVLAMLLW